MIKPEITVDDVPHIKEWLNCSDVEVDAMGDVWVCNPQKGHWLNDERKAQYLEWRDKRNDAR